MDLTPIDGQESRKFGTGGAGEPSRPRRRFTEPADAGGLRDVDAVARMRLLRIVAWAGLPGLVFGLVVGVDLAGRVPAVWAVPAFLGGLLFPPVAIVGFALLLTSGAGRVAGTIHAPAGHGGGPRRPYSMAEALVLQGRPEEAAAFYQLLLEEHPAETEAYLRLARLHRDRLGDPEEGARWLRLARERCDLTSGQERMVARELVELYRHRLADPARAAPELARLAERFAGTPEGTWAREELAEVKRLIAEREGRGGADG